MIDTGFRSNVNGDVEGLAWSPDGRWVYVAGNFTSINGTTRNRVARLDADTGAIDRSFTVNIWSRVKGLALTEDALILGGQFRKINGVSRERLGAVDPDTGATLSGWDLPALGSRDNSAEVVNELAITPDERWLVVGGNFRTVGGRDRNQVAVIELDGAAARVADWRTNMFVDGCGARHQRTWIRGLATSPDSRWFVVDTTGGFWGADLLCDTTSRWELPPAASGGGLRPTWVTHNGGDTHWAAHITDAAVYVGGHQKWENNAYPSPNRGDNDGPGAVSRQGISALDPLTGVPLSWNPGRTRGVGVEAFASNDEYLFVGSDTERFNGELRQRLAVVPTAGGTPNPPPERVELPVDLHIARGRDLHRIGFNGSVFGSPARISGPSIDGIDWSTVRDGFVQHGRLVYFGPNNAYFRRSFNGSSFGSPTNLSTSVGYVDTDNALTPYDQPYDVAQTRDAAYDDGRIYYTRTNDNRLWWRYYSLESGIIGAQQYVASSANLSGARAFDIVGDHLYVAWQDGTLRRAMVDDGTIVGSPGSWTVVDAGQSGIDWSSVTAMFSTPG